MRRSKLSSVPETVVESASWLTSSRVNKSSKRSGTGMILPGEAAKLRQPQDGAGAEAADIFRQAVAKRPGVRRAANEPEDASLTGGTRSLMRRVMGLNVTSRPEPRKPVRLTPPAVQARVA